MARPRRTRMGNSEFDASLFHSALHIPHFDRPTGPGNERCLMVSAGNALDPGPEKASQTLTFI
jgi:hypothetical protein